MARTSFWKVLVFETFTVTPAESPEFPAASRALAVSVCEPLGDVRVSHASAYGSVVSSTPVATPSTENWTPMTPTLSAASAVTVTMSLTVAPAAGESIATVGGVGSPDVAVPKGVVMSLRSRRP